jgi:lipopolysaccharide biosynthesis glycosyltransferase
LRLEPELPYFNSGVLLIDLQAWRRLQLTEELIECLHENRGVVVWWDQYALNVVLARRWKLLDPRWNQGSQIYRFPNWRFSNFTKEMFRAIKKAPYVVHFTSPEKPWHPDSRHPFRRGFFHYLDRTDWAGWRPADDKSWPAWFKCQRSRLQMVQEKWKLRIIARLRDIRDWAKDS